MTGKVILPIIINLCYLVDIDTPAVWDYVKLLVMYDIVDMVWPEE